MSIVWCDSASWSEGLSKNSNSHLISRLDDTFTRLFLDIQVPFFNAVDVDNFGGLGVTVTVVHMSFSGEPGYELHVSSADAPKVRHRVTLKNPIRAIGCLSCQFLSSSLLSCYELVCAPVPHCFSGTVGSNRRGI